MTSISPSTSGCGSKLIGTYVYWSAGRPLILSTASNCTWSPWGPPMRLSTRSSADLIVVPVNHVRPSGLRWYMEPMMTKSEPSLLAW